MNVRITTENSIVVRINQNFQYAAVIWPQATGASTAPHVPSDSAIVVSKLAGQTYTILFPLCKIWSSYDSRHMYFHG